MPFFASLYRRARRRVRLLTALALVLLAACVAISARLAVVEDITSLMPTRPPGLAGQFAILREAPLLQGLSIAVGGDDPSHAASVLSEKLRSPEIPRVISGSGKAFDPALLPALCRAAPALMDERALGALPGKLKDEAMRAALRRDRDMLLTPQGIALRDFLAMDPLGVCAGILQGLSPSARAIGIRADEGRLLNAQGSHALVLAEPAVSMADSHGAARVMERVRGAVQALPPGTEAIVVGGHRHTEENAKVIREDVNRILPASLALLSLAFLLFIRTLRGLCIVLLPSAALAAAAAVTGLMYGGLSGIVLGFGSVVLGITADYAIHVYFALRSGADPADSLQRVSGPVLLGAMTTLAGFAAFFSSSIPCITQMTVFSICGVLAALVFALGLLPLWLGPGGGGAAEKVSGLKRTPSRPLLACVWAPMLLGLALLLHDVPVNGDIRALSYASERMHQDEERMRDLFGGLREQGLYAVRGGSLEEALRANDRIWSGLERAASEEGRAPGEFVTSLAPLLPSAATQAGRVRDWRAFWEENGQGALARLDALSARAGFSREAFEPFKNWIAAEPAPMTPELLSAAGLEVAMMLARPSGDSWLVYSLVREDGPSPALLRTLGENGGSYVSGRSFRAAMDEATRADLLRFGALSLLGILVMSAASLRSPARMGIALLPVACGLACVLAVFRFSGTELNIFHAMALPLVMALSVDYGVFILAHLEGRLGRESRKGVLLSGITTLSGFGVLLLARHPALFSIGQSVSLGLGAALVVALVLLPGLAAPEGENSHA